MEHEQSRLAGNLYQLFYMSFHYAQGNTNLGRLLMGMGVRHYRQELSLLSDAEQAHVAGSVGVMVQNTTLPPRHRKVRNPHIDFENEWSLLNKEITSRPQQVNVAGIYTAIANLTVGQDIRWMMDKKGRLLDTDPRASYYRRYVLAQEPVHQDAIQAVFADVRSVRTDSGKLGYMASLWEHHHLGSHFFPVPSAVGRPAYERP